MDLTQNNTVTIDQLNDQEVLRLMPLLVYLGIIAGTGIPGNILVCLVYWKASKRSTSRFFIWWLAVIDVISCFVLFLEIVNVVNQLTYTNVWLCKCTIFFTLWPILTSGFALCLISIDRFRRVCRPLQKQISQKMARGMCLLTVVIAFLFSWPSLILFGTYEHSMPDFNNVTSSRCTIQKKYHGTTYIRVYNGLLWILFMSALVFLCLVYIIIGKKIRTQMGKHASRVTIEGHSCNKETVSGDDNTTETSYAAHKSLQNLWNGQHYIGRKQSTISHTVQLRVSSQRHAKARKSAFIMFLISFVFVVSFLPYLILRINEAFDSNFVQSMSNTGRAVYKFFLRTYFLNCAVNPFIYCTCAATFRQEVRTFFRRMCSNQR